MHIYYVSAKCSKTHPFSSPSCHPNLEAKKNVYQIAARHTTGSLISHVSPCTSGTSLCPQLSFNVCFIAALLRIELELTMIAILLSGCSSSMSAISNIYVVSLKYSPQQSHNSTENPTFLMALATVIGRAQLEIRVGYFGLCVLNPGGVGWTCSNNITDLRSTFNDTTDPLDVVNNGSHFKDDIIFPYLM